MAVANQPQHDQGGETQLRDARLPEPEYRNPTPVVVLLVPVLGEKGMGLLTIRRALKDGYGKRALPGGYQMEGEGWRDAGARELFEEAGIQLSAVDEIEILGVEDSTGCKQVLLFGIAKPITESELPPFVSNEEVSQREIIYEAQELAFPTHTKMAQRFFNSISSSSDSADRAC